MPALDAVLVATLSGDLDQPAHYIEWGPIQISVGNLVMIWSSSCCSSWRSCCRSRAGAGAAATTGEVPHDRRDPRRERRRHGRQQRPARARAPHLDRPAPPARAYVTLPPDKLLPEDQPEYVASWIYVFGVATARGVRRGSSSPALVLTFAGPQWYHLPRSATS